jgi:hypothetical protein
MKFRIITDGLTFRIEKKSMFRWELVWLGRGQGYDFSTYKEAYDWIRFKYGMTAEIQRNWVLATGKEG